MRKRACGGFTRRVRGIALYLRGAYLDTEELASYTEVHENPENGHEDCNESNKIKIQEIT